MPRRSEAQANEAAAAAASKALTEAIEAVRADTRGLFAYELCCEYTGFASKAVTPN